MHSSVPELGVSDVGLGGGNDSGNVYALLITITSFFGMRWGERRRETERETGEGEKGEDEGEGWRRG